MSDQSPAPSTPPNKPASERSIPAVQQQQDRRQHPRFKPEGATILLGKPSLLASLGFSQKKDSVTNLAQGGVLVKARKRYAPGARMPLEIEIPSPADKFSGEGIVRWCAQSAKDESHFYVGIQFENLDALTEKKLVKMSEWFMSAAFRTSAARKEASSAMLKKPKFY